MRAVSCFVLIVLLSVTCALSGFSLLMNEGGFTKNWWSGWALNFSTEILGAIVIYLLFERLIGGVEQREQAQKAVLELRDTLKFKLGSSFSEGSKSAADDLRRYGWLTDGSLNGVNLHEADLKEANLYNANMNGAVMTMVQASKANFFNISLENANLTWAALYGANLSHANLKNALFRQAQLGQANLQNADLSGAVFVEADLHQADLSKATLKGANFARANLGDARLVGADLTGANFAEAELDDKTILPDGERWHREIDLSKYGVIVNSEDHSD